jgi:putative ABC transport system permease protein
LADLVKLALWALWQQKLRSTLTTLGVVFGTFVLVASLSVRSGVRERVIQEHARFRELREVHVFPRAQAEEQPSKEDLEPRGDMSDEKRQRLREEIKRKWQWTHPGKAQVRLNQERVADLRAIPHVRSVRPQLNVQCRGVLGNQAEYAMAISAVPGDERLASRIVAGQFLASDDTKEVIVSEHLLYELGVADDADVAGAIGRKLRLEHRSNRPNPSLLVTLLLGRGKVVAKDEGVLGKVVARLPEAIAKLDLSAEEKAAVEALLKPQATPREAADDLVAEEFSICGVMRGPSPEESSGLSSWEEQNANLLLPASTMADFVFRTPALRDEGYLRVVVEVDDVPYVKEVTQRIESMGLAPQALIAAAEREQAIYTLIFSAMTVVAIVGLLVSALGITNTTLMSVLERVREIGVMKAIGARDGQIQAIFLIEGTLIGLLGGAAGVLLAWAASHPADAWVQSMVRREISVELHGTIFAFPWSLLLGVPLFATLVTTLAALLPARRAARVNPVAALRHE